MQKGQAKFKRWCGVAKVLGRKIKLIGIPIGLGIAAACATAAFRDFATADSLSDGLAVLITLNAVASGLTYALMGKAAMLKGRTAEGESFGLGVSVMVASSIAGALLGVVHIVWSPDWVWLLPFTAGLLVGAPALIPVLAIQEQHSRRAEVADASSLSGDQEDAREQADHSNASSSGGSGLLRLRPKEFVADPSNPFENDVLGREDEVKTFCSILTGIETPAVLAVDAPWGTGKTAFMRMCAAWIRSSDFPSEDAVIAEFNAWKQSHTGSPIKDIVAAITNQIPEVDDAQQRIATILRREAAKVASGGLVTDEVFEIGEGPNAHVDRFRRNLRGFAEARGSRLIVFVDELDRCRPDYAMEVLECLRHLFDTRGVMVVLTVNQQALKQAVRSLHGLECKDEAERYLKRFVDQTIWLPIADKPTTKEFVQSLWNETGLGDRFQERKYTSLIFEMLLEVPNMSLRDLEQAAYRVATVFASIPGQESSMQESRGQIVLAADHSWIWEQAALGLVVLREADQDVYEAFSDGTDNVANVAQTLRQLCPETDSVVLDRMELALLAAKRNGISPFNDDETRTQYHAGRRKHYDALRERYERWPGLSPQRLPDIEVLFGVIEMVNSATEG